MRQVYIPRYGPPEVLCLRDVPAPPLTDTTVRLAVLAISVNFADIMARQGLSPDCPRPPMVVGYEVAGTLAQSYQLLTPLGRLIMFGVSRLSQGRRHNIFTVAWQLLPMPWFHPLRFLNDNKTVIGIHLAHL